MAALLTRAEVVKSILRRVSPLRDLSNCTTLENWPLVSSFTEVRKEERAQTTERDQNTLS